VEVNGKIFPHLFDLTKTGSMEPHEYFTTQPTQLLKKSSHVQNKTKPFMCHDLLSISNVKWLTNNTNLTRTRIKLTQQTKVTTSIILEKMY